ncbi:MAG: CPBP family intramembrane metalloprotease [Bacteroidales bacterium]|jgi:membrane protease YdiL (CAAX protease family)|nr:CPBP family intramembrane metalloprotease [Bacteroidales bacterium]
MLKNLLANSHPFFKIIMSVFIMLTVFLALLILAAIIAMPVFNLNFSGLQNVLANPLNHENINILKYFQTIQTIGLFIIPPFFIIYIIDKKSSFNFLQLNTKTSVQSIIYVFLIMLAALPIINFFAMLNSKMQFPASLSALEESMKASELAAQELIKVFLNVESLGGLFFNLFMIALLPAIGEELIFRGVLQKLFIDWTKNIHWGIILSAFLFSFIHFQFYGFIPRMMMGILFGYLLVWSGSIWLPILAHFLNNSIAVVFYYYLGDSVTEKIDNLGATQESFIYLFISVIVFTVLSISLYKKGKYQKKMN